MHYGLPFIEVLARPLLTPVRVGNWPVEFRVFFGGAAEEDAAISFYYPQADEFEITPALESAAEQARTWGKAMYAEHQSLGLTPWLPPGEPNARSEEHTSELQSLMRISYAVFCLTKKKPTI